MAILNVINMFILGIILIIISIIKLSIAFSNDIDKAVDSVDIKNYSKHTIKGIISWIFGFDGVLGLICGIFILIILW